MNPKSNILSEASLDAIRKRRKTSTIGTDVFIIKEMIKDVKSRESRPDVRKALDLLGAMTSMVVTLGADIDYLLNDREELVELLETYEALEEFS